MEGVIQSLVVMTLFPLISSNLEKDLKILSRILPGVYSNRDQYLKDANLPSDKRHKSVQAIIRPVEIGFLSDAYNFYVEKFSNYKKQPFKQWIYSFETNHTQKAIILSIYDIVDNEKRTRINRNWKIVERLNRSDLSTRKECQMTWRKLTGKNFHGTTGFDCVANPSGEKVQIEISGTLTARELRWQEGWYRLTDGHPVLSSNGPYIYKKVKKIKGPRYRPRLVKQIQTFERQQKLKSVKRKPTSKRRRRINLTENERRSQPHSADNGRHDPSILSDSHLIHKESPPKYISTFGELKDVLLSGLDVHFSANMSGCLLSGESVHQKLIFGGSVDMFDIEGRPESRDEVIRFSVSTKRNINYELFNTLREFKIYRDGTTVVDIYRLHPKDDHVIQQSMGVCKLFDPRSRAGSTKFFTTSEVSQSIRSFKELQTVLTRGHKVSVVAELPLCSHGKSSFTYVAGKLHDYDLSRSGDLVTFSLTRKFSNIQSVDIVNERSVFFDVHSTNKADILIADVEPSKQSENILQLSNNKFVCDFGINSSTRGLTFFHIR